MEWDKIIMKKKVAAVLFIIILLIINFSYASYTTKKTALYDVNISNNEYGNVNQVAENTVVVQTFTCNRNGLNAVEIMFGTYDRDNNTKLSYELSDVKGKVIAKGSFDQSELTNNAFYKIEFNKKFESKGKKFTITIRDNNTLYDEAVTILTSKGILKNTLSINGKYANEINNTDALVMRYLTTKFDMETYIVLTFFELFIFAFIKTIYKFLR